jgi:hypothetical protein
MMSEMTQERIFESASDLKVAHEHLLEQLDHLLDNDTSAAGEQAAIEALEHEIHDFLEKGAATGVFVEDVKDRTACQVLLDFWTASLARAARGTQSARLAPFDGERLPDLKDKPCPYVGLEAFRERTYFFGRESDTQALLNQLTTSPLIVVIGASGSGKSSLVMGGLLAALAEQSSANSWRIAAPFTPGDAVLARLAQSIQRLKGAERATLDEKRFLENSAELAQILEVNDTPAMIVIDQFEEVFTLSSSDERDALVSNLAKLVEAGRGHRVILTLREEFRARVVQLRPLERFLDKAWYSMRPMSYEELRAAVERPAGMVNLQFESGIIDDIVKKVLGQPAALPLLQFTLLLLWEKRDRNRITWQVYRKIGDPLNALKTSADDFYWGLAPQTRDETKRILLKLVRVDEFLEAYRQPVRKRRLLEAGRANTAEVLELLATKDYVRITLSATDADSLVEVKHEALIRNWPLFVAWIDEKRIEQRQRLALTEAAQRWGQSNKPVEGLLTGWQLQEAKRQSDLSELESEFVEASVAAVEFAQREKEAALRREALRERKLRYWTIVVLVLFIIATICIGSATMYFHDLSVNLEAERNNLAKEYESLQSKYNKLFALQVERAVAPSSHLPSSRPVTIYLHYSSDLEKNQVEEIAKQLRANNIKVPDILKVRANISQSQVRYFRPEDKLGAEEIIRLLSKYLGIEGDVITKFIGGFENVPDRQYEIWFAANAFPTERKYYVIALTSDSEEDIRREIDRVKNMPRNINTFANDFPDIRSYRPGEGYQFTLLINSHALPYKEATALQRKAKDAGFRNETWLMPSDDEYVAALPK